MLKALKNLHEELEQFHQDTSRQLQLCLPRTFDSIEKRQRFLESRIDALECRKRFPAFKETCDESVHQQLKALRRDLQVLHQSVSNVG